jgi:hypothetical protein
LAIVELIVIITRARQAMKSDIDRGGKPNGK